MQQHVETRRDRTTLVAFLAMVVGIAGNITAVKYIAREGDLDPMWAAGSRFVLAALIFAVAARVLHAPMPRGRALVGAVLYGALSIGAFFAFVYWGLLEAPAGLAGVVLATGPLLTFLFALAHGQERFRWASMIGAAIVLAGTALIFSVSAGEGTPVLSLLAILAASACAAEGTVVVKGFPQVHPAARNAIAMAVGAMMLLILMPFFGESYALPTATSTWVAQAYLVTFGTVGVFGLYLFVLSRWSASATSYEFVLAPVVGIALAAWLFDERITLGFVIGSILVLVGVYLGALRAARD
ncbi:MAG: DMT family transporter [Actinomycetota bacterium]